MNSRKVAMPLFYEYQPDLIWQTLVKYDLIVLTQGGGA